MKTAHSAVVNCFPTDSVRHSGCDSVKDLFRKSLILHGLGVPSRSHAEKNEELGGGTCLFSYVKWRPTPLNYMAWIASLDFVKGHLPAFLVLKRGIYDAVFTRVLSCQMSVARDEAS